LISGSKMEGVWILLIVAFQFTGFCQSAEMLPWCPLSTMMARHGKEQTLRTVWLYRELVRFMKRLTQSCDGSPRMRARRATARGSHEVGASPSPGQGERLTAFVEEVCRICMAPQGAVHGFRGGTSRPHSKLDRSCQSSPR